MDAPQSAGEKRISEPDEEAGLSDCVHAFSAPSQSLHEQNLDETVKDEIAARSVGERLLDDRVYRSREPSRGGIGGPDMDESRQQTAEQAAVDRIQFEITTELLELRLDIWITVSDSAGLTGQRLPRVDFAGKVTGDREPWVGRHQDEIAFGETYGFVVVDCEPALPDQHEAKSGEIHPRTAYGPTSSPFDSLRSDRARPQQSDHVGEGFHVPDDL